jgi:hypothetical protein
VTGEAVDKAHYERSDISVVPAAGVIAESMVMLALARFVLEKTGGDSMTEVLDNLRRYQERIARTPAAPVPGDGSGGHGAGTAAVANSTPSDRATTAAVANSTPSDGAADASEDA